MNCSLEGVVTNSRLDFVMHNRVGPFLENIMLLECSEKTSNLLNSALRSEEINTKESAGTFCNCL